MYSKILADRVHELKETQKASCDGKTILIIAITVNAFAEDIQKSFEAGMNGYLFKALIVNEMLKAISKNVQM